MALVLNDRVKETTTTTGTGTFTLAGAVTGFETFGTGVGNSNTTYYAVTLPGSAEFEVGLGTLSSDSSTIARTTVISSSNSDNAVNFSAGTKTIFCTLPASKTVFLDASGNATLGADLSVGDDLTVNGGVIELRSNSGAVGQLKLYCEVSNNHAQTISPQAHGQSATNTLTLPGGSTIGNSDATLVSDTGTQTLTNKTLTSPKINEDVAVTSTATEINKLDGVTATTTELNYVDVTTLGTVEASKAVTADANGDVLFPDNEKLKLGTGGDLEIYHDGSNSIVEDAGTGGLRLKTGNAGTIEFNNAEGDTLARFVGNGDNQFFHNNVKKFETTSAGATVTGTLAATLSTAAQTNITSLGTLTGLTTSGNIELGHASDTTLARSSAGVVTIEGNTILTTGNSDTPATTTSSSDADFVLVDDGGTMKKITPANLGITSGSASKGFAVAMAIAL